MMRRTHGDGPNSGARMAGSVRNRRGPRMPQEARSPATPLLPGSRFTGLLGARKPSLRDIFSCTGWGLRARTRTAGAR